MNAIQARLIESSGNNRPGLSGFHWLGWLWLPVMVLSSPLAKGDDSVQIKTNYYHVTGSTIREIQRSQAERQPWKTRATYAAQTEWEVKWNYRYRRGRRGYRVEQLNLDTRVKLILPRWLPPQKADPEVVAEWKRYSTNLVAHEMGHVAIARKAATTIRSRLGSAGPFDSAAELRAALNREGNAIMAHYKRQDREYDVRTRHGASQGALLRRVHPPPWKRRPPPAAD